MQQFFNASRLNFLNLVYSSSKLQANGRLTLEGSALGQSIFNEDTISGHVIVAVSVAGSRFKSLLRRRLISM
ncbi:MAG: hypothetical protein WCA39_05360 [Nitrososphaeraceae archaeon]